jgi:hypothetical protein
LLLLSFVSSFSSSSVSSLTKQEQQQQQKQDRAGTALERMGKMPMPHTKLNRDGPHLFGNKWGRPYLISSLFNSPAGVARMRA